MGIIRHWKQKAESLQKHSAKKVLLFAMLSVGLVSCEHQAKPKGGIPTAERIKPDTIIQQESIGAGMINSTDPNNFRIEIERIDKEQFDSAKQQEKVSRPVEKITDLAVVQKRLAGIVEFKKIDDNNLGITRIHFRNGTSMANSDLLSECGFVAYFPTEDILLLEGGHTTDVTFDLATGKGTYDAGNPELMTTSPNGKYRLNKVFEGQECFYHFIQERKNGKFQKVAELNEMFEKKTNKWLCVIEKECWTDDNTLYFGLVTQYHETGNEYEYYRVKIMDGPAL